MPVSVRAATLRDEAAIFALLPQLLGGSGSYALPAAREVFRAIVSGDHATALVATGDQGEVLGVITVSFVPSLRYAGRYAQIEELVVDEAARGRDAGAALVRAAIAAARAAGCVEIGLYSRERTRPFYEKLGFAYPGPELRMPLM